jgi:hypothetical protein
MRVIDGPPGVVGYSPFCASVGIGCYAEMHFYWADEAEAARAWNFRASDRFVPTNPASDAVRHMDLAASLMHEDVEILRELQAGSIEREKFAEMVVALRHITEIQNKMEGDDWQEIDEARLIARDALYAATGWEGPYDRR